MRRLLLLVGLLLTIPTLSEASPCTIGSLQSYIGLGATGCSLGGATFFGFDSDPSFFLPSTEISASSITVTPTAPAAGPQLAFGLSTTAIGPSVLGVLISYSASGLSFTGANLSLTGASATGDGVITAVEDLCLGGSFGADPTICSGTPKSLVVAQDAVGPTGPDSALFISSFFDVFTDITIDGGPSGSAILTGSVANQFTAAPQPVPEPLSMLLVGSGLLGIAARRRKRR